MSDFSRRSFLAGLSAIPLTLSLKRNTRAVPPTLVRYDAMSPQGQDMLKTYAGAVKTMMNSPEGNPVGWLFQWYTHRVRRDKTKAGEIGRIYPTTSPQKDLAQATWNTCQAHGLPPQAQKFFLPWHRMYVFYLERIVRKVSGRADFALPYWNYTNAGVQSGPRLPKQFRMQGDLTFGALFVGKRNPVQPANPQAADVNGGQPIDLHDPGALDPVALEECTFVSTNGVGGFSNIIDGGLHGNIHVLVGNRDNMGDVPWAAFDPIFWLHHCNIDRLWESWNRLGGLNPTSDTTWMGKKFTFADETGNPIERAVEEFVDIAALGYSYDSLLTAPKPICQPVPDPLALVSPNGLQRRATVTTGAIQLQASPVRVTLEPEPPQGNELQMTLNNRIKSLRADHRLYVVANGVRAETQPGVLYHVYLDLPANKRPEPGKKDPNYIGTLNFFDATGHDDHGDAPGTKSFSINVTRAAKRLQARRRISATPSLTIAPVGQPAAEAKPVIGEISLVEN